MNQQEAQDLLKEEGFAKIFLQEDKPGTDYAEHVHEKKTAHVIVDGSMVIGIEGRTVKLGVGDRFDIPAHAPHTAKIGDSGCRYIIGE